MSETSDIEWTDATWPADLRVLEFPNRLTEAR